MKGKGRLSIIVGCERVLNNKNKTIEALPLPAATLIPQKRKRKKQKQETHCIPSHIPLSGHRVEDSYREIRPNPIPSFSPAFEEMLQNPTDRGPKLAVSPSDPKFPCSKKNRHLILLCSCYIP